MTRWLRDALAVERRSAVVSSLDSAAYAVSLETQGAGGSVRCAQAWLGAVLSDLLARLLGYRGPTLEESLGRPPRPRKEATR
jgi:hypothetical protein